MKLCFISNLYPRPGQPQRGLFNAQLVRAFAGKADIQVVIPAPGFRAGGTVKRLDADTSSLSVFHLPFIGRNLAAHFHARALEKIQDRINGCDAVIAAWLYPDGCAAARLVPELGVPVWIMVLGSDIFHLQSRTRMKYILEACRNAAGIICVAKHLKAALVDAGVSAEKVHVVPNGVDTGMFRREERGDMRNVTGEMGKELTTTRDNTVLWVGNLVAVKGPDVMLEAWKKVQDAGFRLHEHKAQLVMIGDGTMRKSLRKQARKLGIEDSVQFTGSISHADVAERMGKGGMLCLTSRSEGMPNVVLEALASGLPVVSTDAGAVPEMLKDRTDCRIVRSSSLCLPEDIARAIIDAPERGTAAGRAGTRARSWSNMADDILELIKV